MTVLESTSCLQSPLQTAAPVSIANPASTSSSTSSRKRKLKSSHKTMECSNDAADLGTDGFKNEPAPSKKQKIASKQVSRGRRKSRWKLKFHHQALPPEYLKHYKQQEKKRRITETKKVIPEKPTATKRTGEKLLAESSDVEIPVRSEINDCVNEQEIIKGIKCQDSSMQEEMRHLEETNENNWPGASILSESFPHLNIDLSQNKAFLENLLSNQIEINRVDRTEKPQQLPKPPKAKKPKAIPSSGRIMNFSDLPYMGEITLDGVKPRRGRKPKKADICHLIYKNYGQIFPGAPNSSQEPPKETKWKCGRQNNISQQTKAPVAHPHVESPLPTVTGLLKHSEVQNRIINSLLERRLTQKIRGKPESFSKPNETLEEPLNLCLKDLKSLKIKLSRKHGNIYETKSERFDKEPVQDVVEIKKEVIDVESDDSSVDDSDLAPFNLVTAELRDSDDDDDSISLGSLTNQVTMTKLPETPAESPLLPPDPMMYWPTNNYFYPPLPVIPDMYYPKLPNTTISPPEKRPMKPTKNIKSTSNKRLNSKPNNNAAQVIARRKRSAIFIPPVPAENTTNPATEVSICKFKFIGGAKPSLQEKKMLSVDSGGNFRYYSGTGDKSMRGYEYFPRESLQQCQENTGCSPSGVFLTASALGSGEKIPEDVGHSGFFDQSFPLQVTATPTPSKPEPSRKCSKQKDNFGIPLLPDHLPEDFEGDDDDSDSEESNGAPSSTDISLKDDDSQRRAKRSRKSLAREKLEQTFKENGFLIQTQQLESAEGATYCKFRQLRKFTRYLFRSWKDYLPGNVRDLSENGGVNNEGDSLAPSPTSPPDKIDRPES